MKPTYLLGLGAFLLVAGCAKTEATGPANYAAVQAVFSSNCTRCHGGDRPRAKLSLESYDNLMKSDVVKAGDANSQLLLRIEGKKGRQMPPGRTLSDADVATIRDWITSGAKR